MKKFIRYFIYFMIIALPFAPKFPMTVGNLSIGNVYISTVLIIIVLLIWIMGKLPYMRFRVTAIEFPLFLFFFAILVSLLLNIDYLRENISNILRGIQFLLYISLYFIVINTFKSEQQIKRLIFLLLFASFIELILGAIHEIHPIKQITSIYDFEYQNDLGLSGTFDGEHNNFASYILLAFLLLVSFFIDAQGKYKIFILLASLLFFTGILFTFSRTIYASTIGGISVIILTDVFIYKRFKNAFFFFSILGVAIIIMFRLEEFKSIFERASSLYTIVFLGKRDFSFATRLLIWRSQIQEAFSNPLSIFFGMGFWRSELSDNYYVKVLSEVGIFGLTTFLYLTYSILKVEFNLVKNINRKNKFMISFSRSMIGITFAYMVIASFGVDQMVVHRTMGNFWILIGLIGAYDRILRRDYSTSPIPFIRLSRLKPFPTS